MATDNKVLQDIWQNGQLAFKLYSDPRVSGLLKIAVPVLAFAYLVLPIDFLPDFIPFIGQLDEVAIFLLLIRMFISMAPTEVVQEYRGAGAAKSSHDDVIDADFHVVNDG